MAGMIDSNRDLWQLISARSVIWPCELIASELNRNKNKLTRCLSYFEKYRAAEGGTRLKKERNPSPLHLDFTLKLSSFLDLDELLSYDLYSTFLLRDYKGSRQELQDVLNSERHRQSLMLKICEFYYSERVYLVRCVKHLLSYCEYDTYPYYTPFRDFVMPLYADDKFVQQIITQYLDICEQNSHWNSSSRNMADLQIGSWLTNNLREQCELLELLLLYYRQTVHKPADLLKLLQHFKKQGFGRYLSNKRFMDEKTEALLQRIGFLQIMLIIEGLEVETLIEKSSASSDSQEDIVLRADNFKSFDSVVSTIIDADVCGPLLLIWTVIRQLRAENIGKMGNRALQLRVFEYLHSQLSMEPFSGRTMIATVCHNIIYGMLVTTLSTFHEETLGDTQFLHHTVNCLLQQPFIADDFWSQLPEEGLRPLLHCSLERFPFQFQTLMNFLVALSKGGIKSAQQVVHLLQNLSLFTEPLDRTTPLQHYKDSTYWLVRDKQPFSYPGCQILIPSGTKGEIISTPQNDGGPRDIVHWSFSYDGWEVMLAEVHTLLSRISYGAGMVDRTDVHKVTLVYKLTAALAECNAKWFESSVQQLEPLLDKLYQLIERFCTLPNPPLELLSAGISVLVPMVKLHPQQVWKNFQKTGFLPHFAFHLDDLSQAAKSLNSGAYGCILAGQECIQGRYPITTVLLELVSSLIEPLHASGQIDELTAVILFLCQEIFPVMYKWRYHELHIRETIGQQCLEIFKKILDIKGKTEGHQPSKSRFTIQEVVVQNLLCSEAKNTILEIIGTGVDVIEAELANQNNETEGSGVELIRFMKLAFSTLNKLLMSWPEQAVASPIAHTLSVRPAGRTERHLVATVALYIYHRHDPELPTQATLLLKNLALLFPMSMLACLGNEGESIRDIYLGRLQTITDDVQLKVVSLEWLTGCVQTQPGIIEMFLNVELGNDRTDGQKELLMGKDSCLQTVVSLIKEKKQDTYQCPPELLCSVIEFLHSLWKSRRITAMTILREIPEFWKCTCLMLTKDLPFPSVDKDMNLKLMEDQVKTCAHVLRILALELYYKEGKPDKALQNELDSIISNNRFLFWSEYIHHQMLFSSSSRSTVEQGSLELLLAWRDLLVVMAADKTGEVTLPNEVTVDGKKIFTKDALLLDVLNDIQAQFEADAISPRQLKLASVASALYLMAMRHWCSDVRDHVSIIEKLCKILQQTSGQSGVASVHLGLLGVLVLILQHVRTQSKTESCDHLTILLPVLCELLQASMQAPFLVTGESDGCTTKKKRTDMTPLDAKFKLQITATCLLKEIICTLGPDFTGLWLSSVNQYSLIQCLIMRVADVIKANQEISFVQSAFLLFLEIARTTQGAELLFLNGLNKQLCIVVSMLYATPTKEKSAADPRPSNYTARCLVYRLYISLMSTMLQSLGHSYVEEALTFVGSHQDRMHQCLEQVGLLQSNEALLEVEESCRFLAFLSVYRKEWRCHLPTVLQTLMMDVCTLTQKSVGLLLLPRLLQFLIEKQLGQQPSLMEARSWTLSSLGRQLLQHQSSTVDDNELCSPELLRVQHRLLNIISQCLVAMRHFSPNLCDAILDQSFDVTQFDPFVSIQFGAPSIDQKTAPTFGTFVSIINLCIDLLSKMEGGRSHSPLKSTPRPFMCEKLPIKRPLVMFVMENAMFLTMSHAMRHLRDPDLSQRDKQLLKRELGAELTLCLSSLQRPLRCVPSSPLTPRRASLGSNVVPFSRDYPFIGIVDTFVKQILK